ncbi:MAG TPA: hypothetical protein VKN63_05940 [Afifellaceae bacterium]|nr:hypothetical protein [Afifellaceae bacterium]
MHASCRCALITIAGAITVAAATIAVGISAGRMIDEGVTGSLRPYTSPHPASRRPFTHHHEDMGQSLEVYFFNRS